ncbi:hypothetical protein [Serratia marcescens]|uniref:hypothetical protein n=1 Tax=Serratia marcescens TaxID=615 RepID=UPI0024687DC4|nr:hypothetical protein [Serratia marcescens]WGL77979.1 hypothetical protein QFB82_01900 [Serratia marcescens]
MVNAYVFLFSAFFLLLWLEISSRRALIIIPVLRLLIFGFVLLAITLMYARADWATEGARLVTGFFLGALFLFSCLQLCSSLLQILQHQGKLALAERYRRDAERLFPNDMRFTSVTTGRASRNEEQQAP